MTNWKPAKPFSLLFKNLMKLNRTRIVPPILYSSTTGFPIPNSITTRPYLHEKNNSLISPDLHHLQLRSTHNSSTPHIGDENGEEEEDTEIMHHLNKIIQYLKTKKYNLVPYHFDQYVIEQQQQQQQQQHRQSNQFSDHVVADGRITMYQQLIHMYLHEFHHPIRAAKVWQFCKQQQQQQENTHTDLTSNEHDDQWKWIRELEHQIEQYTNQHCRTMKDLPSQDQLLYRPHLSSAREFYRHSNNNNNNNNFNNFDDDPHHKSSLSIKIQQIFDQIQQQQQQQQQQVPSNISSHPCLLYLNMKSESDRCVHTQSPIPMHSIFYVEKPLVHVDLFNSRECIVCEQCLYDPSSSSSLSSTTRRNKKKTKKNNNNKMKNVEDTYNNSNTNTKNDISNCNSQSHRFCQQTLHKMKRQLMRHLSFTSPPLMRNNNNNSVIAPRFVFLIMKLLIQSIVVCNASPLNQTQQMMNQNLFTCYPLLSILEPSIIYQPQQQQQQSQVMNNSDDDSTSTKDNSGSGSGSGSSSSNDDEREDLAMINYLYQLLVKHLSMSQSECIINDLSTFERLYLTMSNYSFGDLESEQYFMGQLICFVNHSCSPNAKLVFDNEHRLITLVALRDIEKDEQITISYFGDMYGAAKAASSISDEQYHKMRRDVAHHHGFTCAENCFCESHVKQFMLNRQNKG